MALRVRGAELELWSEGAGTPLLCLHESATSSEAWRPLAAALEGRLQVLAPDRRGWRRSPPPEGYRATTVDEQAEDGAAILASVGAAPALLCGAGLGAVAALDLLLRRPELAHGAVLVEPPLLAFSAAATERLSADRVELGEAIHQGGAAAAVDLCLGGGLEALSPGTGRLPRELTAPARERPAALFAELVAVPGWTIPGRALASSALPARVVVSASTPALVREACESLAARLGGAELRQLAGPGPAHLDAPAELAALVLELETASGAAPSP